MVQSHFDFTLIALGFLSVAIVYSSIGHAGASGYTAILAFFHFSPIQMRSVSLFLNIVVGILALLRFYKAGLIQFKKVIPFLIGSIPLTFLSARWQVDKRLFYVFLAAILLLSSLRLILDKKKVMRKSRWQVLFTRM